MNRSLVNFMANSNLVLVVAFFSPMLVLDTIKNCNFCHDWLIVVVLIILIIIIRSLVYHVCIMRKIFMTSRVAKWILFFMIGLNTIDMLTTIFSGSELKF